MEGMNDLSKMFCPKSVVVVGASREKQKIGAIVMRNIRESGYKGKVFAVNPKAGKVQGIKCYPDCMSLPEVPDLAVVAIPAAFVNETLKQIGEKGTKNVVVFSAGYKEIGEEGVKLEKEMGELSQRYQLNILGPNCLGFVNNLVPINATFGQMMKRKGNLRFVSQSGAIAASIFDWFEAQGLGFSEFITLGNKAVLGENEVLENWLRQGTGENGNQGTGFLEGEAKVRPVGMYLESIREGKKFMDLVKQLSLKDPVFILKPGKSQAAAKAMQSHTGAIAGEDAVLDQALRQSGAIRCEGLEEMFDLSRAFSWEDTPKGPNVVVISNAGGPAVISADVVADSELQLAPISGEVKQKLSQVLPRAASFVNPVDVLGDALADRYKCALEIVLAEEKVDGVIVILTPQVMTEVEKTARYVGEVSKKFGKPVMCAFMGGGHIDKAEKMLNGYRVPSFRYPERAIRALSKMYSWYKWKRVQPGNKITSITNNQIPNSKPRKDFSISSTSSSDSENQRGRQYQNSNNQIQNQVIKQMLEKAKSQERKALDSWEGSEVLGLAGMRVPEARVVNVYEEARDIAAQIGYPVVIKMIGEKLLHKTEMGAVITGIGNETDLGRRWEEMWQKKSQISNFKTQKDQAEGVRFLVQKQVGKGVEVIVGVKRDPSFGPVLMLGAGGTLAELIKDRNLWILPMSQLEARTMIEKAKVFKLLNGFRGEAVYELKELDEMVVKMSELAEMYPMISEMEINPVIVNRDGVWAVDVRILLN